jgi:hypothetical protein
MDNNYMIEKLSYCIDSFAQQFPERDVNEVWYKLEPNSEHFTTVTHLLKQDYPSYDGHLYPIYQTEMRDDVICIYNNQFYLIHTHTKPGFEVHGIYETAEEVWEKVIKPDIEEYFQ